MKPVTSSYDPWDDPPSTSPIGCVGPRCATPTLAESTWRTEPPRHDRPVMGTKSRPWAEMAGEPRLI